MVAFATEENAIVLKLVVLIAQLLYDDDAAEDLGLLEYVEAAQPLAVLGVHRQAIQAGDEQVLTQLPPLLLGLLAVEMTVSSELVEEKAGIPLELFELGRVASINFEPDLQFCFLSLVFAILGLVSIVFFQILIALQEPHGKIRVLKPFKNVVRRCPLALVSNLVG